MLDKGQFYTHGSKRGAPSYHMGQHQHSPIGLGSHGYLPGAPVTMQVDDDGVSISQSLLKPALLPTSCLCPTAARHRVPAGMDAAHPQPTATKGRTRSRDTLLTRCQR